MPFHSGESEQIADIRRNVRDPVYCYLCGVDTAPYHFKVDGLSFCSGCRILHYERSAILERQELAIRVEALLHQQEADVQRRAQHP